jgi:hypothetical protein
MKGFYFFRPENTDTWRLVNYGCVYFYYPIIIAEEWIGTVDGIGCEPNWRLSGSSALWLDPPDKLLNDAADLLNTGYHPATVFLDRNLHVISVSCCPLCSAETEPAFDMAGQSGAINEKEVPLAAVREGNRRLAEYRNQPECQKRAAAWKTCFSCATQERGLNATPE